MYNVGYMCGVVWDIMYIIMYISVDYVWYIWRYYVDVVCYVNMIL